MINLTNWAFLCWKKRLQKMQWLMRIPGQGHKFAHTPSWKSGWEQNKIWVFRWHLPLQNVSIEKKFNFWSEDTIIQLFFCSGTPKNTFTFGITKIAPPLPSSKVNDNFLLLSVTQTELNDMVDDGGGLITSKPIFGKGQKEYNHFYRRPSIPF